eukprot:2033569-Pyramimonas_sp.AAC.1
MNSQAKDWLSAETTAQPLASQSMGAQEGTLGRTEDHYPSERNESVDASMRRPNSLNLPREQASEAVFDLTEGDSSVDSTTRSRAQASGGRYGAAKSPAERPSELVSVHPGFQPSIDLDLEMEKLLDHAPAGMSGAASPGAERAAQFALRGQSEDVSDLQSEGD